MPSLGQVRWKVFYHLMKGINAILGIIVRHSMTLVMYFILSDSFNVLVMNDMITVSLDGNNLFQQGSSKIQPSHYPSSNIHGKDC